MNGHEAVPKNQLVYNPHGFLKATVDINRCKFKNGFFYLLMQYKFIHSALREVYFNKANSAYDFLLAFLLCFTDKLEN